MLFSVPADDDALETLVIDLATQYARTGSPVHPDTGELVDDQDYDVLYSLLKQRRPESRAFAGITPSQAAEPGDLVVLDPPMTSIEKADGDLDKKRARLKSWMNRCDKLLGYSGCEQRRYTREYKQDGLGGSIRYEKGVLVEAALRPDNGVNGTNVTDRMPHVKGVPARLKKPLSLTVRGEFVCLLPDFEKVQAERAEQGLELRANPRNHTKGCFTNKDPRAVAEGRVSFIAYNVVAFDDWRSRYENLVERADWFRFSFPEFTYSKVEYLDTSSLEVCLAELEEMEKAVPGLPFEVDGVVLNVADLRDRERLGHHGDDPVKEPHGSIAWKFAEERAEARVERIHWEANRTGKVTPVAILANPVRLAGSDVQRASCSNVGWAERMGIGPGSLVQVGKAGKIIPKVYAVLADPVDHLDHPTECPTCGVKLEVIPGAPPNKELMCRNADCMAKQVKALTYYLVTLGAKGIGDATSEAIIETGKVHDIADLYGLQLSDLMEAGFSERESVNTLATIHLVKREKDNVKVLRTIDKAREGKVVVSGPTFFAALGVPRAGHDVGKLLFEHFGDFDSILGATEEMIKGIAGIGPVTASNVVTFFDRKSGLIRRLLKHVRIEKPVVGKFTGMKFVLSGTLPPGRGHWQKSIEAEGGVVGGSVSKKTNFLVLGPDGGGKKDDAARLNVPIITLDDLVAKLGV